MCKVNFELYGTFELAGVFLLAEIEKHFGKDWAYKGQSNQIAWLIAIPFFDTGFLVFSDARGFASILSNDVDSQCRMDAYDCRCRAAWGRVELR